MAGSRTFAVLPKLAETPYRNYPLRVQRYNKNFGGYHGETIDIETVLREVTAAATAVGWRSDTFYECPEFALTAWHRLPTTPPAMGKRRRIYISAGIHGDEPATTLAALRLLREDLWPADAEIILIPCLNPSGFMTNHRENAGGLDLNRDYLVPQSPEVRAHVAWLERQGQFNLCLCVHEDWEAHGFYLYELNPEQRPSLAEDMVAAVAHVCPIDNSSVIEGREAQGGIIRPSLDPRSRPQWPEAFWLISNKTALCYTLEAPSDYPLKTRVNALTAAVHSALANCG